MHEKKKNAKRRILLRQQRHPNLKVCVEALHVGYKHLMPTHLEEPVEIMFQYLARQRNYSICHLIALWTDSH